METIQRDYADKDVKFYYVYKNLAHPEKNDYVSPFTLEERLLHVRAAKEKLGTKFTWICDSMDNQIKHALGGRPNSEFVIDPAGKIVHARSWSKPTQLRSDLEKLVGKSDHVTLVKDLDMKTQELGHEVEVASGVVPRLKLPSKMSTIKITPHPINDAKHYVKLHAEADASLLKSGSGKLYLGFFVDPIYDVHWNNLVTPIHYEIEADDRITIKQKTGDGPAVEADSDVDPREFLIDVENATKQDSIEVTVKYFACSKDWCRQFTQKYTINFEADRDGGTRMFNMGSGKKTDRSPRNSDVPASARTAMFKSRLEDADTNNDGKISNDEAPPQLKRRFDMFDSNKDGFLDSDEQAKMLERMSSRRGGR